MPFRDSQTSGEAVKKRQELKERDKATKNIKQVCELLSFLSMVKCVLAL